MTKHILMIVTSHDRISDTELTGLWFEEFASPYEIFRNAGYSITVASPKGGQTPIDPRSVPSEEDRVRFADALTELSATRPLDEMHVEDYDAVFLPGGHGTMYDMPTASVGHLVSQFADAGKVIAAVCHGPAGLVAAFNADGSPYVQGRRLTAFTNEEEVDVKLDKAMPFLLQERLTALGATFIPSPMWNNHVVVNGRLITGQNPQSGASTAQAVVQVLSEVAETR